MIRSLIVFGTRPEAIKLAPVVLEMNKKKTMKPVVCVTAQHRQMLDQVLKIFDIQPEYDLNLMKPGQRLEQVLAGVFQKLPNVIEEVKPDILIVQGDTTTTFAAAKCAFCQQIPIGHVEAGLRTFNKYSPFPEEINRRLTSCVADFHFAPTKSNRMNLIKEGFPEDRIWITGNTVIDSLLEVAKRPFSFEDPDLENIPGKLILVTAHRRESFGEPFRQLCSGLRSIAETHPEDTVLYPVHLNPNVQAPVKEILGGVRNVRLVEPLDYEPFVHLLKKAYLVLTDSGGIQEESPSLGVPALVMRETTERPEGVEAGTVKLVGTSSQAIATQASLLLDNPEEHRKMAEAINPYGDGTTSAQICDIIEKYLPDLS